MTKAAERRARVLVDSLLGPEEGIETAVIVTSERHALSITADAVGLGVVVGLLGALVGGGRNGTDAATVEAPDAEPGDGPPTFGLAGLSAVDVALVVVTSTRLLAWSDDGDQLICDIPLTSLTAIGVRESKVTPSAQVLRLGVGSLTVEVHGTRPAVRALDDALTTNHRNRPR